MFTGAALGLLMATSVGCGPGQDNATTAQAECNKVSVEGEDYCVIKQEIIIETGYTCPVTYLYRYEVRELTVCSNRTTPPTQPIIFELWRLAYGQAPPAESDMGGGDMSDPDMPGGDMEGMDRTCEDIASDYAEFVDNVPRTCQQGTDCELLAWQCNVLNQVTTDICTAVVTTGTDVSILTTLHDEYSQMSCPIVDCPGCPSATYTCDQGMCVGRIM